MDLRDFKIVDMKRSEIDKEKSSPAEDFYEFINKVYYKEYEDGAFGPYHFYWERKTDKGWELQQAKYAGCKIVKAPKDGIPDYWPEPLQREENGDYVYMDAILVQQPLSLYIAKLKKIAEDSARAPLDQVAKMRGLMARDGVEVDDATLARLIGIDQSFQPDHRVRPSKDGRY